MNVKSVKRMDRCVHFRFHTHTTIQSHRNYNEFMFRSSQSIFISFNVNWNDTAGVIGGVSKYTSFIFIHSFKTSQFGHRIPYIDFSLSYNICYLRRVIAVYMPRQYYTINLNLWIVFGYNTHLFKWVIRQTSSHRKYLPVDC